MTPCLLGRIGAEVPKLQVRLEAVQSAITMDELVEAVTVLVQELGVLILEGALAERAAEVPQWPACGQCGRKRHSRGRVWRSLVTSLGPVRFQRPVGRCPGRCMGSTLAPLDRQLGMSAHQRHSAELQHKATLLAVFMPLQTASAVLSRLTGVRLAASTVWNWIQQRGKQAAAELDAELVNLAAKGHIAEEVLDQVVERMTMLIGADGVMVPFRPQKGSPKGTTIWREVKVAVITRLGERLNRTGLKVRVLHQRRLVAVLGDIDALSVRLRLEALRQGLTRAPRLVWVSDGARGLWRIYHEHLEPLGAIGVLDFYHTAGQLWTAAETWYFRRLPSAHAWFAQARHKLRYGQAEALVQTLRHIAEDAHRPKQHRPILHRVANYLDRHRTHLDYPTLKAAGLPIGSGFIESAVKWLIQQRFKGVGMRWSEDGFNNLLLLRLAWANDRFDALFTSSPNS
jgi:hypothetical protein